MMTATGFTLLFYVLAAVLRCEPIDRNINPDYTPVMCNTWPCVINCNVEDSCRTTNISCPLSGEGDCIINLIGKNAGYGSTIYTNGAININITIEVGSQGARSSIIYAHTKIGAKLRIHAWSDNAMRNSKLFVPYGVDSEFTLICGGPIGSLNYQCAESEFFDDYSTTVTLEGYRNYAYEDSVFKNIFRDNPYFSITKDSNIPFSYRGSVNIYSDHYAFRDIIYYGTDHGDWTIRSDNPSTDTIDFRDAIIYADHSFITNESYTISVTSTSREAMHLTLYASQNNVNIELFGLAQNAFWNGDTGTRYLTVDCTTLPNIIINSFKAVSTGNNAFYKSTLNINVPVRSVLFVPSYYYGFRLGTYTFGDILNDFKLITNCTDSVNCYQEFYQISLNIASIQGDLVIIDTTVKGEGLYDSSLVIGDIGGDVIIRDDSGSDGGDTGYSTEFTFGNIAGKMNIITTGFKGFSFENAIFNIGNIGGSLLINDTSEAGHSLKNVQMTAGNIGGDLIIRDESIYQSTSGGRTCYLADFIFNDITGNVYLISIAAGYGYSFEQCTFNINSIGGDLIAHDISEDGRSFIDSYFNIKSVFGSVLFKDDAWGSDGGNSVQSSDIIIDYVGGDIDLIDDSIRGRSFYQTNFNFQFIGGNLYCNGYRDTINDQTFRKTNWIINKTLGNITFKSFSSFAGGDTSNMNIYNPNKYISFYSVQASGLKDLHAYFGVGSIVDIIVENGADAIQSSTFDCRDCERFTLTCNNDADCDGAVDIYCPENNSQDKCKIYCSEFSSCNGMEIWTTNGYCEDVRMYCDDQVNNACLYGSSTKIYCTNEGAVAYGATTYPCTMSQDVTNNNEWYCGLGVCANDCTERPTTDPTYDPTTDPTYDPTIDPTTDPSNNPSTTPTRIPSPSPTPNPTDNPVTPGDPTKSPTGPTKPPTTDPTIDPTKDPTTNPSIDPTIDPTSDPTYDPTIDPTIEPTTNPSTNPTVYPTTDPSSNPTMNPTAIPTNRPSISPTLPPTDHDQPIESTETTNTITNENTSAGENMTQADFVKDNLMMIIVAGLIALVLLVLCAIFCVYCRKRKAKNNDDIKNMERMKSNSTLIRTNTTPKGTTVDQDDGEIQLTAIQPASPTSKSTNDSENENENENENNNVMIDLYGNNNALKMWLSNLGLEHYLKAFKEQGFSDHIQSLSEITDQDLKDMGVNKIAHRRTIMKEIQILKNNMNPNQNIGANVAIINQNQVVNSQMNAIQSVGGHGEELYNQQQNVVTVTANNNNNLPPKISPPVMTTPMNNDNNEYEYYYDDDDDGNENDQLYGHNNSDIITTTGQ